jgi:CRISPR/Cas system CSM-associated protein Csm4 (group 5 of RAMP superfamily)
MSTKVKLTQAIVDDVMGIVFPVFSNDNLESIVNRYLKLYPHEAKLVLADFNKSFKLISSFPDTMSLTGSSVSFLN